MCMNAYACMYVVNFKLLPHAAVIVGRTVSEEQTQHHHLSINFVYRYVRTRLYSQLTGPSHQCYATNKKPNTVAYLTLPAVVDARLLLLVGVVSFSEYS